MTLKGSLPTCIHQSSKSPLKHQMLFLLNYCQNLVNELLGWSLISKKTGLSIAFRPKAEAIWFFLTH